MFLYLRMIRRFVIKRVTSNIYNELQVILYTKSCPQQSRITHTRKSGKILPTIHGKEINNRQAHKVVPFNHYTKKQCS